MCTEMYSAKNSSYNVGASKYPSCQFQGFPVPLNGCGETRVYCNSAQMIYCVPIKRRGNLCFEQNTSEVRFPNQLLSISQKITTHISSPLTVYSIFCRHERSQYMLLFTSTRQFSFLWKRTSFITKGRYILHFYTTVLVVR